MLRHFTSMHNAIRHYISAELTIWWQTGRRNVRVCPRRGSTGDTILGRSKPELTFWTEEKGLEEIA